jgi:hypothetical protein
MKKKKTYNKIKSKETFFSPLEVQQFSSHDVKVKNCAKMIKWPKEKRGKGVMEGVWDH